MCQLNHDEYVFLPKGKFVYVYNPESRLVYKYLKQHIDEYLEILEQDKHKCYANGDCKYTKSSKFLDNLYFFEVLGENHTIYKQIYENISRRFKNTSTGLW